MEDQIMEITYYIVTGLFTLITGAVGFFLRQYYKSNQRSQENTNKTLQELTKAIEKLNITVSVVVEKVNTVKEDQLNSSKNINTLHDKVDNHETRITVLETKIK